MTLVMLAMLAATPVDQAATRVMGERFEALGRSMPEVDPALSLAASDLAQVALARSAAEATELVRLTGAISRHHGFDASPRVMVFRGSRDQVLDELRSHLSAIDSPVSHVGIGVSTEGARVALCVLLTQRQIELGDLVREFQKPPKDQRVCARLLGDLTSAASFVTRPDGRVDRFAMKASNGQWCTRVTLHDIGEHTVEILADGPRGPEVVALFFVWVGVTPGSQSAREEASEPKTEEAQRAEIIRRINHLRGSLGAESLVSDARLEAVAMAYARRMAHGGFFGHVSPDGGTFNQRMAAAGVAALAAGENLGLSSGAVSAHFGIEHSPGHRKNLTEPRYTAVGVGIARRDDGLMVVVEVLALPRPEVKGDPVTAAYQAIALARQRLKLPPLTRSADLERLALEHVKTQQSFDVPKIELPGVKSLYDQIFEGPGDVAQASIDAFISDAPGAINESTNLKTASNQLVGVGVRRFDSPKYGAGRYWFVVIYASRAP